MKTLIQIGSTVVIIVMYICACMPLTVGIESINIWDKILIWMIMGVCALALIVAIIKLTEAHYKKEQQ